MAKLVQNQLGFFFSLSSTPRYYLVVCIYCADYLCIYCFQNIEFHIHHNFIDLGDFQKSINISKIQPASCVALDPTTLALHVMHQLPSLMKIIGSKLRNLRSLFLDIRGKRLVVFL